MPINYMKTPFSWTAAAVLAGVAAYHPGGEASVKYFPDGHAEIATPYEVVLFHLVPGSKASRRFREDNMTLASSATAAFIISGINAI